MTTFAIIGAGRNLGEALARRFGKEGYSLALIARNQERVDELAADLVADGFTAKGYAANVRNVDSLVAALDQASQDLGLIEVMSYNPLPQKEFLRPLLESTVGDIRAAVEFSIYGPVAAVHQVLQGMRVLKTGSLLFVNGGSAVQPVQHFAGTSIAFAGETAYIEALNQALKDEPIYVGQIIIPGAIIPGDERKDPTVIADTLWRMHTERTQLRVFATELETQPY
ncbi:SDR family NAD(P)-dependent oxidoreductase [Microbacterium sediminis]|uniref:Dehydrogenase n=1 Tax=Microbacterium sediminis TaxID=904291 RepID=A0A1B9NIN8_9MICO|nr:SDR family NAD(P)-dependent oxidoreductase [Microbacterium sediminis]OCG76468.1 dehydrogenase [Microbacterium sediminis]QBR73044.1 SDR family NAD(P)-dependent oxidoreductase [Microbacterium sediminis]